MSHQNILNFFIFSLTFNCLNAQEIDYSKEMKIELEPNVVKAQTAKVKVKVYPKKPHVVEKELPWQNSIKDAVVKSREEKKIIMIYFTGSDWCTPCKILDKELFKSAKFEKIAEKKIILLKVDNPRNKDLVGPEKLKENFKLIKKYRINSYPTVLFINKRGRKIAKKEGFYLSNTYLNFIRKIINKN